LNVCEYSKVIAHDMSDMKDTKLKMRPQEGGTESFLMSYWIEVYVPFVATYFVTVFCFLSDLVAYNNICSEPAFLILSCKSKEVKFTLEQTMQAEMGSRGIALLSL
jgi:hypothetical protein